MIDEEKTLEMFKYTSKELSYGSKKKVCAICNICGKERLINFKQYRDLCNTCCKIGRKHSEKTKRKMGLFGKNNPNYGKFGENSPTWNPDLTDEDRQHTRKYPEYHVWRKAIFERDNYTCQICFKMGGNLNAHHLEGYTNNPELRTTLSNGIIMCKKHHNNFHHIYGRHNNTKEQYIEFKKQYKKYS